MTNVINNIFLYLFYCLGIKLFFQSIIFEEMLFFKNNRKTLGWNFKLSELFWKFEVNFKEI